MSLQLEYKEQKDLRLYDPNDRENTTYVYFDRHLRGTKLAGESRLYTLDRMRIYADTVPMLTLKELQDRYHVSYTYLYGKRKERTTAFGRIADVLTGVVPPQLPRGYKQPDRPPILELQAHEKHAGERMWENSFMAYDQRRFAKMFWTGIDRSLNPRLGGNLCPVWVDMNHLTFRAKNGTFTKTFHL